MEDLARMNEETGHDVVDIYVLPALHWCQFFHLGATEPLALANSLPGAIMSDARRCLNGAGAATYN
jgi:hypothetical protein